MLHVPLIKRLYNLYGVHHTDCIVSLDKVNANLILANVEAKTCSWYYKCSMYRLC